MTLPLVTAVIPAYNHERYVQDSLRSLVSQTYSNIELLVFNDGSSDRTHDRIVDLVESCRLRFSRFEYVNQQNRGLSVTLNQALAMAAGSYFTVLASDDIALPGKIERLASEMERLGADYAACFGDAIFINSDGIEVAMPLDGAAPTKRFLTYYTAGRNIVDADIGSYVTLLRGNYLPAMSALIRTDSIRSVGGWTPGNAIEDWELWLKLSRTYRLRYLREPVALYRIHGANEHVQSGNRIAYWKLRVLMKEKNACRKMGLTHVWREEYLNGVIPLLRNGQLSISQKRSVIDMREVGRIVFELRRRAYKRVRGRLDR